MAMTLSMKPTGWFQIGWSAELGAGDVLPMRFLGRELVAYRTESGCLVVLDAYCEHLGAHLGYGGTVNGEDITCPFHGWQWNPQGRNTCIPYQDRVNRARRIRSRRTAERDGIMYLWHDVNGREPTYDVPDLFGLFDEAGTASEYRSPYPAGTIRRDGLEVHPQYVIENGVDFAHFRFVHRAADIPTVNSREFGESQFRTNLTLRFSRPSSAEASVGVLGGVHVCVVGVGLSYAYAWGAGRVCSLTAVTPVDDEHSVLWFSAWVSTDQDDEKTIARRTQSAINQVLADLNIWQHQRYTEPPGLATAEAAGFREIRRWAHRFYPPGHLGSGMAEQDAGVTDGDRSAI